MVCLDPGHVHDSSGAFSVGDKRLLSTLGFNEIISAAFPQRDSRPIKIINCLPIVPSRFYCPVLQMNDFPPILVLQLYQIRGADNGCFVVERIDGIYIHTILVYIRIFSYTYILCSRELVMDSPEFRFETIGRTRCTR